MRILAPIRRSLRAKVTLLILAITVSALALTAVGLVVYDLRLYERQFSSDLTSEAEVLARATGPALAFSDVRAATRDLAVVQVRRNVQAAALYTREGRLFATFLRGGLETVDVPAQPGEIGYLVEGGYLALFHPVLENGEKVGTIHLRATYDPWSRLKDYLGILLVVMVASLGVAAFLSGWLQSAITAPILEVARLSHEVVQRRDYSLRAAKRTQDEIGELVDSFNAMMAEIGRHSEALRQADQRKDEFLATLAHELRNPLAPIRNALELMRLAGNDPARAAKAREVMQRQVGQMVRLVDDLIDVSRITTGKLGVRKEMLDLRAVLRDAIEIARPFIEQRGHVLDVRLPLDPLAVDGDPTRLAQVFSNLLNNAAKYTDSGGRIELVARAQADEAVVSVRDNGIGLAPESITTIFDMFVQVDRSLERSQAGLGVGLTLASRLVELHGGRIAAASAGRGMGSEFTVWLPRSYGRTEALGAPGLAPPTTVPAKRVLLADDNADFVDSLEILLAARGHDVRVARDGAEAVEAARDFRPVVAFIDIGMPRVNGYDVARALRADPATSDSLLVACTGWGMDSDRARAREAGFDRHLVKPVDPVEIVAIVENR